MENNNQDLRFKTNINCGGCIAAVKPHLESVGGVNEWNVDITNKDKILTVQSNGITAPEVVEIVQKAGFKIEPLTA